jgi:hypothetical protein
MLFVSVFPRLLRRCVLPIISIGLTAASCFAQQTVFFVVDSTPYDNQMARVGPVLASAGSYFAPAPVSLVNVNQWMIKLHALRYKYSKEWKTPDEVRISATADCKGKAIALYEEMAASGAENVRFIIGKHRAGDAQTHAWLEWDTESGSYVLDPTFNWLAARAEQPDSKKYVPFYAYEGAQKYRAVSAPFVVQNSIRALSPLQNW